MDEPLNAPDYAKQIAAAARLMEGELSSEGAPAKIAWLLEHQYSPEGLSFTGLKSSDGARVKVLMQAAECAGCAAHLGIVHIEESGAAQEVYHDYSRRGRGRYRDDEDDLEESGSDDFEIIDVSYWRHYVSQWRDQHDQPVEFGEIPLEPYELLPAGALDDEEPDEQRLMEASGNKGASFERSYHRAALVIWQRARYAEVLLQSGIDSVLPYLRECIEACEPSNAPASVRKAAAALARRLQDEWANASGPAGYRQPARPKKRDEMLKLLQRFGDAKLVDAFIAEVVLRDYDGSDNEALVGSAVLLGAKHIGRLYAALLSAHMAILHGQCVDLLHELTCQHLHHQIESHNLDMTHVTERKGSPQTLVCTKDWRSYHRRCEQYRKDIAALESLSELAHEVTGAVELPQHIETARRLANEWSPA